MRPIDNPTREVSLVLAAATLLTALIAAPVLLDFGGRIFGNELGGFHPDPYIVIDQFEGAPRLTHFTQPATDWAGIALARLTGGVAAYNLLVLVTFPLASTMTRVGTKSREKGFSVAFPSLSTSTGSPGAFSSRNLRTSETLDSTAIA